MPGACPRIAREINSSPDNKDFNGSIPTPSYSIREENWMKKDDDTFFEDEYDEDEEDLSFPNEDEEEEVEEVGEDEYEEIQQVFHDRYAKRSRGFILDPWPRIVFILTIIGLGVVFITPPAFWALWNYFILADYFLIVFVGVAIVFSLATWSKAGTHRLRWAGPTNAIVALLCGGIGTLDTASWIFSGAGLFAGIDTPLISLCIVIVFFSLYTLWLVQRSFGSQER
jgi:hypothetical protein